MKTSATLLLLTLLLGVVACRNECVNCEEYSRTLALYIKVHGNAKDSISRISGNVYNIETGTRSVFITSERDSVYSQDIQIYENINQGLLELNVFLKEDTKKVVIDLSGKIDFTETRVQVISIDISFSLLGLEIHLSDYQTDQETELN
jgi:lipoprotein